MKIFSSLAMAGLISLCLVFNALAHAPFAQNVLPATNAIQNIIGPEHGEMICASVYADCLYSAMMEQNKNNPVLWIFSVVESAAVNQCIKAMNGGKCRPLCRNAIDHISVPWSFENGQEVEIAFGCIERETKIEYAGCKSTPMPFTATVEFDAEIPFFVSFCQFGDTLETFGLTDNIFGLPLKASIDENGDISCLGLKKGESDVFEDSTPTLLPACIEDIRFHFYGCPQYELLTIKNTGDKCVVDVEVELQPTNGV